ncbi:MSC_0622 family F1-like ATPase gamma subunit [[Mycoplasma] gypis]|uniref:ATP synthase gamma chain n=1 Tax=[Mycoplasma] gypis TaxID=92404 RepID=A0ABZ2RMS4_9BACT|nr:hypothetical protein [[Mycoplasma] gypis]MBN0919018.1 hypothetical protein [[Mycoplasma] gypis]
MNLKKLQNKLASYTNIYKVIESEKNITLINILKLSKQNNYFLSRSIQSKHFIEQITQRYEVNNEIIKSSKKIQNKFLQKLKLNTKTPKLWVYITEKEKYETDSYAKHEESLNKNADFKKDIFISIGERANNFCKQKKANVVFEYKKNDVAFLSNFLPKYIENFIENNGYHDINFIINSAKIKDSWLSVLPIEKFNLRLDEVNKFIPNDIDFKNIKIYPNIDNFIESEVHSYLTYITLTLLNESSIVNEKYNLIAQNKIINDLEDRLFVLKKFVNREKRQLEVEEISLLSYKKDLIHQRKGKDDQK